MCSHCVSIKENGSLVEIQNFFDPQGSNEDRYCLFCLSNPEDELILKIMILNLFLIQWR